MFRFLKLQQLEEIVKWTTIAENIWTLCCGASWSLHDLLIATTSWMTFLLCCTWRNWDLQKWHLLPNVTQLSRDEVMLLPRHDIWLGWHSLSLSLSLSSLYLDERVNVKRILGCCKELIVMVLLWDTALATVDEGKGWLRSIRMSNSQSDNKVIKLGALWGSEREDRHLNFHI